MAPKARLEVGGVLGGPARGLKDHRRGRGPDHLREEVGVDLAGTKLAWRSAPESNSSRQSLRWTRSIRPVIARASSTTASRGLPPAWAWQVSRQKPTFSDPSALEIASHTPRDLVEMARHRVVAAGGVLDQERDLEVGRLDRLAPVVEADRRVVVLVHMSAVDDQPPRPDRRGGVEVLLEQLAGRDADAVVGRRDVDDVRRVDVEADPRGLGVGPQRLRAPAYRTRGPCIPAGRRGRTARAAPPGPRPRRSGRSARRGPRSRAGAALMTPS